MNRTSAMDDGDAADGPSLQVRFTPRSRCFGCGPANELGLRIRSFEASDGTVVTEWQPRREHEAFDGFVSGGILGTLADCHSNWTAIAVGEPSPEQPVGAASRQRCAGRRLRCPRNPSGTTLRAPCQCP